jgi:hypothetical protein
MRSWLPVVLAVPILATAARSGGAAPGSAGELPILAAHVIPEPGEQAVTPCEKSILALHAHDALDVEYGSLEQTVFETCAADEFHAFNGKVKPRFQYPGGGMEYLGRTCRGALSAYQGTKLCDSVFP